MARWREVPALQRCAHSRSQQEAVPLAVPPVQQERLPIYSVITGTIFENTKYPLVTWFQVAYLMCQSKKGMSALQIHRQIGSGSL